MQTSSTPQTNSNSNQNTKSKTPGFFKKLINLFGKNWKKILLLIVILVVVMRVSDRFAPKDDQPTPQVPVVVETFSIGQLGSAFLGASCIVQPITDVDVVAQTGGNVTRVNKEDGDVVTLGEIIFEIENTSERVSVADANASLQSAQFALEELLGDNDATDSSSLLAQTKLQQQNLIDTAQNNLFNTDLRAYPVDNPDQVRGDAPTISGNYTCEAEGDYVLDVYGSSSRSGASFRFSGLESGTDTVVVGSFASKLGSCGLEVVFPEDFSKNEEWVIPVPNTRSSQYFTLKKAYENAIEGKNITINQTGASSQEIAQERSRVEQARLRYQLAIESLNKTIVRATAAGTLAGFDLDDGQFVASNTSVAKVKTVDQLELVTYVDPKERIFIEENSEAFVGETPTSVVSIAGAIDPDTRKLKVALAPPGGLSLIEGTQLACSISRKTDATVLDDNGVVVPLSAISVIGIDPFVFEITSDGLASGIPITTGALLGESIVVYGIEDSVVIAADARGIREGDTVEITNQ